MTGPESGRAFVRTMPCKVPSNPARLASQQKEPVGRLRFLSREEYDAVCADIREKFPEHLAEFIVSVNTGMRLSEEFSCTWSQLDFERRAIDLTNTKNGSSRTIHLNADALVAINSSIRARSPRTRSSPERAIKAATTPVRGSSHA